MVSRKEQALIGRTETPYEETIKLTTVSKIKIKLRNAAEDISHNWR